MNTIELRQQLEDERDSIVRKMMEINVKLVDTLPRGEYSRLMRQKRLLGIEHQDTLSKLRKLNQEKKALLSEAFMTTVLEMFTADDISEIWDRVYLNYPHLKR